MLVIEIDGGSHYHGDQPVKDQLRQERLESLGVHFLRFDDIDVKTKIKWVTNEIYNWIETHPQPLQGGE